MAVTYYTSANPFTLQVWAKRLNVEILKACTASKFIGPSPNSIICLKDEAARGIGDKITFGLRRQLAGMGVAADGTLEGEEEALSVYSDGLFLDQLRHAVKSRGKMSEQRVRFQVRNDALSGLRAWFADRIDASCLNQLCGNTAQGDKRYTGLQAVTAPDAAHVYRDDPTATSDDQIRSNFRFTLTYIDAAVERAQTLAPAIRPIRVGERDLYVAFLHTINVIDMRQDTPTGQWLDIQKAALTGGEIEDNPLFAGEPIGIYNGTLLLEDTRVPTGVSATGAVVPKVRRAVLCGAQAAIMAFGRENGPERYTWVEELSDYQNDAGISAAAIWGVKKTVFNSADYATVVMPSYADPSATLAG